MKRGKKYIEAASKVDAESLYTYDDAVKLVKEISFEKFDATIGISVKLNIKKSHSIRDTLVLPNQFAGEKKVLVFAKGEKAEEAKAAGAAFVGDDDLIQKIKDGWLDFDVAVATPDMMKEVGRLGPILGRRGLMPNPKTQTVTMDVTGAIAQLQQGRVEFRADKTGVVNLAIGKVSMEPAKVLENVKIFVKELERKRPQDLKGEFISSVALSSTMGPGVKIQFKEAGK
jgi:large subunit ribosomal protein L1